MFRRTLDVLFPNSLPRRAGAVVSVICLLGLLSIVATTFLSYVAENDAKAINTAGAIRMATYRIDYLLANNYQITHLDNTLTLNKDTPIANQLTDDMDKRLSELVHYQSLILNHNSDINNELTQIKSLWENTLKPAILADNDKQVFAHSSKYINLADNFVRLLQARNESRQSTLQSIQMATLFIIGFFLICGMYEVHHNVLIPINQLQLGTKRFSKGERVSLSISGYREFNELGVSFNDMASTIYDYQQDLQSKVTKKTEDLTQANNALRLLYDFANQVNNAPLSMPKLYELIYQFSHIIPRIKLSLCIHGEQKNSDNRISLVNLDNKDSLSLHSLNTHLSFTPIVAKQSHIKTVPSKICKSTDCNHCELKEESNTYVIAIASQNIEWGELLVQDFDKTGKNFEKHQEMLQTLANLIAIVFNHQKQRQQEDQLILEEERKTIARELHDSIAQSLTYLKMQLAMIGTNNQKCKELLCQNKGEEFDIIKQEHQKNEQTLINAREGVDRAYRQLRELLVTFRLSIEEGDFDVALVQACDEFAQKAGFKVELKNRVLNLNLTANEQVHLLQIVREALSNAWRHANASLVVVSLFQKQNNAGNQLMFLSVQDNGNGLNKDFDSRYHHGLSIMKERTNRLGGEFSIQNNDPNDVFATGVKIEVNFLPKFFNQKVNV